MRKDFFIRQHSRKVVEYAYTHQADGQIDTLALDRDVDDVTSSETYDFDYDQQGQLTDVDYTGTGAGVDESYQYGANGNRTSATVGSSSSAYTPGAYNRLESVDDGTTVTVFGYDPEGNLVLRFVDANENGAFDAGDTDIFEYTWDHRNRLVSATDYGDYGDWAASCYGYSVEYAYDYLNRMVARTVDMIAGGPGDFHYTDYFVYDHDASTNWGLKNLSTSDDGTIPFGANPATDAGQIVLHLDENGAPAHRYLWGPAVDMLLADETVDDGGAEDVAWTLTDHQNSVRDILVLDDNGTPGYAADDEWRVGNHVTYDAWGNTVAETDAAISCLFGWTGRPHDKLTGLQNNGNRWYDAVLAHWQSEDPIAFAAGDANLYRYCGNDPVNAVDPNGMVKKHVTIIVSDVGHPSDFSLDEVKRRIQQAFDNAGIEIQVILLLDDKPFETHGWQHNWHCWCSQAKWSWINPMGFGVVWPINAGITKFFRSPMGYTHHVRYMTEPLLGAPVAQTGGTGTVIYPNEIKEQLFTRGLRLADKSILYSNLLLHEVVWLGALGMSDVRSDDASALARPVTNTRIPIAFTPEEIRMIKKAFDLE